VENLAERECIDPDLARELIRKCDHQRGGFIHFYFDRNWNEPQGYDLLFNTSRISKGAIVESIVAAAKDPKLTEAEPEAKELLAEIILCKQIETALLKSDKLENLHFKLAARAGKVALSGHVHSDAERNEAIRIAGKVKGVERVVDNLQVVNFKPYKD